MAFGTPPVPSPPVAPPKPVLELADEEVVVPGPAAAPAAAAAPPRPAAPPMPKPATAPAARSFAAPARPAPVAPAKPAAPAVAAATVPDGQFAGKLDGLGLSSEQIDAVLALSREVIEQVVWEVVPDLAETMIREEIARLMRES